MAKSGCACAASSPDVGAGRAEATAEAFPKNETLGPWRFVIGECHVVGVNINDGVALK